MIVKIFLKNMVVKIFLKEMVVKIFLKNMVLKKISEKDCCSHLAGGDVEVAGHLVEGERPVHPASILLYLYSRLSKIVKRVSKCHISINAWSCVPSNDMSYVPKSKVTLSPFKQYADSVWTLGS